MKKILTLLTFVFLANALLFGQCPADATPNPTNRTFNLSYSTEADRDAVWTGLASITFPAGVGCMMCGTTITVPVADLVIDGPVSANNVYRIRAITTTDDFFEGVNGAFDGNIVFNLSDGTTIECGFGTTSTNDGSLTETIELFPNPTRDQLTLINGKGQATIFNVLGQPVKRMTIDGDEATVELGDLLNGQYYLQVLQEDGKILVNQFSKIN